MSAPITLEARDVDPMTGAVGDVEWTSTLADFADANAEDAASIQAVRALGIGDAVELGGGACPIVQVRRIA